VPAWCRRSRMRGRLWVRSIADEASGVCCAGHFAIRSIPLAQRAGGDGGIGLGGSSGPSRCQEHVLLRVQRRGCMPARPVPAAASTVPDIGSWLGGPGASGSREASWLAWNARARGPCALPCRGSRMRASGVVASLAKRVASAASGISQSATLRTRRSSRGVEIILVGSSALSRAREQVMFQVDAWVGICASGGVREPRPLPAAGLGLERGLGRGVRFGRRPRLGLETPQLGAWAPGVRRSDYGIGALNPGDGADGGRSSGDARRERVPWGARGPCTVRTPPAC
jgi:hypothetical protein